MKIFRGPSTKPFDDPSHELVAEIDAEKVGIYLNGTVVLVANITKDPTERRAVAHIQLEAADLIALQRRLWTGLNAKLDELETARQRAQAASHELVDLYQRLESVANNQWNSEGEERVAELHSALSEACDIVGTIGGDLYES